MVMSGVNYRFVTDHLGSVRMVINASSGAVVQSINYDEFGIETSNTNPGFQPFGYAGGLYDASTGFVRFGARDYDPSVGRWTAKDPIRFKGGINFYVYAANNAMNRVDPSGLDPDDTYDTADEAGLNAVCDINQISIMNAAEYAGRICQLPGGAFFYTKPTKGVKDNSNVGSCPLGSKTVGRYHTHGADDPGYYNDIFSDTDKSNADGENVSSYLGTPNSGGVVQKYTPASPAPQNGPTEVLQPYGDQ